MKTYSIALIPGDGIGKDVTAAAWAVLQVVASRHNFKLEGTTFPWSCEHYKQTGAMMLEHLGEAYASKDVMGAIEASTAKGVSTMPGKDRTGAITDAILAAMV